MKRARTPSPPTASLLAAFAETPRRWRHSYELSQEIRIESGTLYPILVRLSDQGLLESKWQSPAGAGRPPRHAYRLTPRGVAHAQAEAARHPGPGDAEKSKGLPA